jgi:hypothetical protein
LVSLLVMGGSDLLHVLLGSIGRQLVCGSVHIQQHC